MTPPSKKPLPFPLQLGALELFCHPAPFHRYATAFFHQGEAIAANGYIALRIHRGLWFESDFTPAPPLPLDAILSLPWRTDLPDEWRPLDDIRGDIYRSAPIAPWTPRHRPAPSPVWSIAAHRIRLSHLQLIARLPRCEIHLVPSPESPLHFRFAGGRGLVALDPTLQEIAPSRTHFAPKYCPETQTRIPTTKNKITPRQIAAAREYEAARAAEEAREIICED